MCRATRLAIMGAAVSRNFLKLHRVIVWVILADFDQLFAVVVAAVGMWSTLLQRCPHVHGDAGVGKQGSQGLCLAYCRQERKFSRFRQRLRYRGGSMQVRILSRR